MFISQLINTLKSIMDEYGDMNVDLYHDYKQSDNILHRDPYGVCIDDIKVIKLKPEGKGVYLSNEYITFLEYNGCNCTVTYNSENDIYEGVVTPPEVIEGFNLNFSSKDRYSIENIFHYAVDEYYDFLGNAKITKTLQAVKEINGEDDEDLDYGEIPGPVDEYPESDDDGDYS